jgi:glutamate 5-kinase
MGRLGLTERPAELALIQAVAAMGQGKLIETYERYLSKHGVMGAQLLLTADNFSFRKRYLNIRNTMRMLLDHNVLPIINENDTVSVSELLWTFGDNDRLASLVANLFETPLLILLTDVEGLYDRDPADPTATLVPLVDHWTEDLMEMVVESHSKRSKGGMASKLKAAKMITESGGNVIIASGDQPGTLGEIFAAKENGTVFLTQNSFLTARKRWLGFAGRPKGKLILDDGAALAVTKKGKSLLPAGIIGAEGAFESGSIVSLVDKTGQEIARGLTNYSLKDILQIRGKKSSEIKMILGRCVHDDVVNRDNLQVVD